MSNSTRPELYDYRRVRRAFNQAAQRYDDHAVLQNEVASRLLQRLDWLKVTPAVILDVGAGTGLPTLDLLRRYSSSKALAMDISEAMLRQARQRRHWLRRPVPLCADARRIPLASQSIDMVFSNLALQWCDRLEEVISEIRRILKPDGVFLFSTFGPDTLHELRSSWAAADETGHVHPFMDMHDIGDLLLHAGLQEPVMEREVITLTYDNINSVMADVRAIGAGNALVTRSRGLTGREKLERVQLAYEKFRQNGRLPASYEVIYGTVWSGQSSKPNVIDVPVDQIGRRGGG